MNFRAVTVLIAALLFNVFATDAAYQKAFDAAAPAYNNYDSAQSLYPQAVAGYPSGNSQFLRQYVNPPSSSVYGSSYQSDPYQGSYSGAYPGGYQGTYPLNNGLYPVQEEGLLDSFISTIKNVILRIVTFPLRIIRIVKNVVFTLLGLVSPGFREASTLRYPLI